MLDRLPTVTCTLFVVLIFPPFNVGQKIGHQLLHPDESVASFQIEQMLVVTLAPFVVTANNVLTAKSIKQAVFQAMRGVIPFLNHPCRSLHLLAVLMNCVRRYAYFPNDLGMR